MLKNTLNEESKKRMKIAEEIASKCPLKYGKEIIIVGSVSRGIADEYSDIEVEFLVENLISQEDRINWIKEIGGSEICPYSAPIGDGSEWIIFRYKGHWIEAGWQMIDRMVDNLKSIVEGKAYTHDKLLLAFALKNAIFIRKDGLLKGYREKLEYYPKGLEKNIIMNTIRPWTIELGLKARKTLSKRKDIIPLLESMISDVHKVLRILFAVNQQWEPDWKWIKYLVQDLKIKPDNLTERINSILSTNNPEESLKNCFDLIQDTLFLIPEELKSNKEIKDIISKVNVINDVE